MKNQALHRTLSISTFIFCSLMLNAQNYTVVGTGVPDCFNNETLIPCPTSPGDPFYGQFPGTNVPSYQANDNATVTDLVTGLTWQKDPDQNGDNNGMMEKSDKLTWPQMQARVQELNATGWGGFSDWRIPSIKELYSLTNWNGTDPSGIQGTNTDGLTAFIDTLYFPFAYGDQAAGERLIDSQYGSCDIYTSTGMSGSPMLFGFNFADGRIKGYDLTMPGGTEKVFSFIAVRGGNDYGTNVFTDNGDQTVTDQGTGLMWARSDSQEPMDWEAALAWAQAKNAENYCGYSDWRLPNAKELQSIVDYSRSPDHTQSAAIDPAFECTQVVNEAGYTDWPWFWTSTTHQSFDGSSYHGNWAAYVCFGRAGGWIKRPGNSYYSYVDVHGAGAQRSSPKNGTFLGNYMGVDSLGNAVYGLGPQGDILRINNFVRLVRNTSPTGTNDLGNLQVGLRMYPNPSRDFLVIDLAGEDHCLTDIRVFNCMGQEINIPTGWRGGKLTLVTDPLPAGIYFVRVIAGKTVLIDQFIRE